MKKNLCFIAVALCLSQSALAQVHLPLTQKITTMPVDITEQNQQAAPAAMENSAQYPIQFAPKTAPANRPSQYAHHNEPGVGSSVILPHPIPEKSKPIGHATRHLMQYQANTTREANALPMLGATANKSWERYVKSFEHPIPEWFEERLDDSAN